MHMFQYIIYSFDFLFYFILFFSHADIFWLDCYFFHARACVCVCVCVYVLL